MSSMRKACLDPWVRIYDVKDACRHKKGYTLYKVVSKVFPRNSVEATTEVIVWKRFSDFKKLHKVLYSLHQALHLKGKFPEFVKARFFGRFDEDVVEERRTSALALLQFAAQFPALYNSQIFVKFFDEVCSSLQGAQEISFSEEECNTPPLEDPLEPEINVPVFTDSDDSSRHSDNLRVRDPGLEGTWQYRRSAENISLSSDCSDSTLAAADCWEGGVAPSLPPDLSMFDPLMEPPGPLASSSWLVSALQSCQPQDTPAATRSRPSSASPAELADDLLFPQPFADEDDETVYVSVTLPVPSLTCSKVTNNTGDNTTQSTLKPPSSPATTSSSKSTPSKGPSNPSVYGSSLSLTQLTDKPNHTVGKLDLTNSSNYLFQAATLISRARDLEADASYSDAFNTYKEAVSILLSGVQDETDSSQRDSVRRKIGQYLSHAEEIYKHYLEKETKDNLRWAIEGRSSPHLGAVSVVPIVGHLRGDLCDLGSFKVLGIVGNVILVLDTNSNQTRVIKSFQKSSRSTSRLPNILPQFLPHLVQLHRIYETEDNFFLLLEYGSGGCLWDYVSTYLARSPASPCIEAGVPGITGQRDCSNVYSGQHGEGNVKPLHSPFNHRHNTNAGGNSCHKSSVEDSDQVKNSPANSYVTLLTKYASSVKASERVSLAQCTIQPSEDCLSEGSEDEGVCSPSTTPDVELPEVFPPEPERPPSAEPESNCSPTSDVADIISSSKALLHTVEQTLRQEGQTHCDSSATMPVESGKGENLARCSSLKAPSKKQKNKKRKESLSTAKNKMGQQFGMSRSHSHDHCPRLSSSLDSLERVQRVRHLSEVFEDLEAQRRASSAFHLPETCVRIWAAEILVALGHLHALGIIWQDFNPNNILLGERGHILLSYVCRINCVDHVLNVEAKRNMYSAPEVGGIFPVTPSCDWWSLGAVLYELLTGMSLASCHPTGITSHTQLHLPAHLTIEAKDLLDKLLKFHPSERLGAGTDGIESIQTHPFFSSIDWSQVNSR